jgi:hypothetical protein
MSYPVFREYEASMYDPQNIITLKVGTDTLAGGYCVQANAVAGTYLDGYGAVYTPAQVSNINATDVALVDTNALYYHDVLGNRLDIDDPTVKAAYTGDLVRAIRPTRNKHYFMSNDIVASGTIAAGSYLIPTANSYLWTVTTDITTGTPKYVFLIEEINVKDTFVGLSAITGMRVRCVRDSSI